MIPSVLAVAVRLGPVSAAFTDEIDSLWEDVRARGRSKIVYVTSEPGEVRLAHLRHAGRRLIANNPDAEVVVSLPTPVADRRALWAAGAAAIAEVVKTAAGYGDDVGLVTLTIGLAIGTGAVGLYSAALAPKGDKVDDHVRRTLELIDTDHDAPTIVVLDDQRTEVARMVELLRYFEQPVRRPVLFLWGTDAALASSTDVADKATVVARHLVERQVRAGVAQVVRLPALSVEEFRAWLRDCDPTLRNAIEAASGRDPTLAFEIYAGLRQSDLISFDRDRGLWSLDDQTVAFDLSFERTFTNLLSRLVDASAIGTARSLLELGSLCGRRFTVAAICGAASHRSYVSRLEGSQVDVAVPDTVVDFLDDYLAAETDDRSLLDQLASRGAPGVVGAELWGYGFKSAFLAHWLRQQIPSAEQAALAACAADALTQAQASEEATREELLSLYTLAEDTRAETLRLDHHVGTDTGMLAVHLAFERDIDTDRWTEGDFLESATRIKWLLSQYAQSVRRSALQVAAELWLERASRSGPEGRGTRLAAMELNSYFQATRTQQLALRDRVLESLDDIQALDHSGMFAVARSLSDVSRTLLANGMVEEAIAAATIALHYVDDADLPDILWDIQRLLIHLGEFPLGSKCVRLAAAASTSVGQRTMSLFAGALSFAVGPDAEVHSAFEFVTSCRPPPDAEPRIQALYAYSEGVLAARLGDRDLAEQDLVILERVAASIGEHLLVEAHEELKLLVRYLEERPDDVIVAVRLIWAMSQDEPDPGWTPVWLAKLNAIRPRSGLADELERRAAKLS